MAGTTPLVWAVDQEAAAGQFGDARDETEFTNRDKSVVGTRIATNQRVSVNYHSAHAAGTATPGDSSAAITPIAAANEVIAVPKSLDVAIAHAVA